MITAGLERKKDRFLICTDRELLKIDSVNEYLVQESYWAKTRTIEQTKTAIENSLCFGVYENGKQIGFARVVTDFSTFAYLADVYILPEYQNRGLGKWLIETILEHPDLKGFRRWVLATLDAHRLYEKFGFTALKNPERWMEKVASDAF